MKRKVGAALVVGAGISGIRAALDLAEVGYGVTLIDRSPHIGGVLTQLDYQFPTDRCGMCKMLPLVDRDAASQYCLRKGLFHENIDILLSTEIAGVEGEPGRFQITLRRKPSWVDPQLCIGCGKCAEVCPVTVPDRFNAGLARRKAIYLPVPHAIPNPYVIDLGNCTLCGECATICPTDAIRLPRDERRRFRILVVDDELILRDSLKAWLADEENFTVQTAESGEEALRQLSESPFHLMLLDIKMPGMDGVEVLKQAKELQPDLAVVMMTAYATVETAVEAMKIGALDYLIKPFDPETLIPKVLGIFEQQQAAGGPRLEVGAVVLCGGTAYYDPATGKDTFGYGAYPNVVTSLEFERVLSGTGPFDGRLMRPGDGKPIETVAWIQCVGSRDLQTEADFCSNICCMFAIKEALVVKEKTGGRVNTTLFYMDMRTFGKPFQRYRDRAETEHGVRFERGRVHSVVGDSDTGDLMIRYADKSGQMRQEQFDMVVLAVGQRPSPGTAETVEMLDLPVNAWGFCETEPFSLTATARGGIFVGGAYGGLRDISESVTQASAAALSASRTIHAAGGGLAPATPEPAAYRDVARETPKILAVLCTCGAALAPIVDRKALTAQLVKDPSVAQVVFLEQTCTADGWEQLIEAITAAEPNRVLIGACLPYVYARKLKELGRKTELDPSLFEVVDIRGPATALGDAPTEGDLREAAAQIESRLGMALARLRHADPKSVATVPIHQRALVIGGGIAGMTAASAIAAHGFGVDLVEKTAELGGNLRWLKQTLEGHDTAPLLEETRKRVETDPLIAVHTESQVVGAFGQVGRFHTTVETADGQVQTLEHGVAILATGGTEAVPETYGYGTSDAIITQKALEERLHNGELDATALHTVVMIQCAGTREEPRNYCSRVCCATTLKHALLLKERNPEIDVFVLYRDIMAYGFSERYYTRARAAGVLFIQYDPADKPTVLPTDDAGRVIVGAFDPILDRPVEIETDLLVLAAGVVPRFPGDAATAFGAAADGDGFFQEAEFKWRPVDALNEGVFACGLVHSPRTIAESIATAEAAAQRSLRILTREALPSGKIVAGVRHSICSLCERCIDTCPYGARTLDVDAAQVRVNPVMCQGCGACAAVCPNSASVLEGFEEQKMLAMIDAAVEGAAG